MPEQTNRNTEPQIFNPICVRHRTLTTGVVEVRTSSECPLCVPEKQAARIVELEARLALVLCCSEIRLEGERKALAIESCAELAHEANRLYSRALGDTSHRPWAEAPEWQRDSSKHGIEKVLAGATPEQLHESWCEEKRRSGWVHGPVKDESAKTHPCLVDYAALPVEQRAKDALYQSVVAALLQAIGGVP